MPLWRRSLRNRKRTTRSAESKLLVGTVTAVAVAPFPLLTPSSRHGGRHGPKIPAPASPPPVYPDVAVRDWVYFPLGRNLRGWSLPLRFPPLVSVDIAFRTFLCLKPFPTSASPASCKALLREVDSRPSASPSRPLEAASSPRSLDSGEPAPLPRPGPSRPLLSSRLLRPLLGASPPCQPVPSPRVGAGDPGQCSSAPNSSLGWKTVSSVGGRLAASLLP